jgi:Abortive infection alpha
MGLKDILPVEKIYDDLLSPSVKQVGLALESVFKTARFSTFAFDIGAAFYDNRWQKFLKRISDKVEPQNIVEGQPQIVIPVLNALDLQQEDSLLSELFINLLSATIDKTKQDLAHPAFPNILSQLSHDEAVLLYFLKKDGWLSGESYLNHKDEKFYENISPYPEALNHIAFTTHLALYYKHLANLNLVSYVLVDINDTDLDPENRTYFYVGQIALNEFGWLFVNACVTNQFTGF